MKKYVFLAFAVALIILLTSCAAEPSTAYTAKGDEYYEVGEKIEFCDIESDALLGEITVEEVYMVLEKNFREGEEFVGYDDDGESKYKSVRYEAIVQVCYSHSSNDSSKKVDQYSFSVKDGEGNGALFNPEEDYLPAETEYDYFVVAIQEKSEGIVIGCNINNEQEDCAWISVGFDEFSVDFEPGAKQYLGSSYVSDDSSSGSFASHPALEVAFNRIEGFFTGVMIMSFVGALCPVMVCITLCLWGANSALKVSARRYIMISGAVPVPKQNNIEK